MEQPEAVEELIAWFRRTLIDTVYGEVGFTVTKHEGQITTTKRIHTETHAVRPRERAGVDTLIHPRVDS